MEWLRRLGIWLASLIELSRPAVDERPVSTPPDQARQATWADVLLLIDKLENHGAEYVLVGGYALAFNGLVRQTGDVDVVVRNIPGNNRRWIAALCELPDGAAKELVAESDNPFPSEIDPNTGAEEAGVIRVADEFIVDVMPKACGLAFDDLKPFTQRVRHLARPINVLDLRGLRATKQTTRARDAEDLQHIEAALAAPHGEVSEHVRSMTRRSFLTEPPPPPRGRIELRLAPEPDLDYEERLILARRILDRAKAEGSVVDTDSETLATYGEEAKLANLLRHSGRISDLNSLIREYGIDLPK
jgi:hypothetical protein